RAVVGRLRAGELNPDCVVLLESRWRDDPDPAIADSYAAVAAQLVADGRRLVEVPIEAECRRVVSDPRRGKNMFVLGVLACLYGFDLTLARSQVAATFGKKEEAVVARNLALLAAGHAWASAHLDFRYHVPPAGGTTPQV